MHCGVPSTWNSTCHMVGIQLPFAECKSEERGLGLPAGRGQRAPSGEDSPWEGGRDDGICGQGRVSVAVVAQLAE